MNSSDPHNWPLLPTTADWQETLDTVHLWLQIVGKIRLEHSPWINHSWIATLYVSSRGLTTSLIPHPSGGFEIEFNFTDHKLDVTTAEGKHVSMKLKPMSVADFYHQTMDILRYLDRPTSIYAKPVEIPDPITPFPKDSAHSSYDAELMHRLWLALVNIHRVFSRFRTDFIGKSSPVHIFWGAFDLALTRFSGRTAPKHPGGVPNCPDWVSEEAYSHEVSSAGFWPGTGLGEAAFYAYAYPEPEGFRGNTIEPGAAYYHEELGEYILPYDAVRSDSDPDRTLLRFLESSYEAAANSGNWIRKELERRAPKR